LTNLRRRAVIAVDLDYFYAQCEEVRDPSIRDKPVVICVFSGRTEDSGAVSTANYVARELGVRSGMPIAFAKKILKSHQDARFLPMDLEYYQSVSERIMEIIRSKGEKFEQASIDEAYLEIGRNDGDDFGLAEDIGRKIKEEILSSEKMMSTVGIGQNKLMAKMAVDSKKPNGFTIIPAGSERLFLNPLPAGKLFGVGPKTEKKLNSIGIRTVGDLASADQKLLSDLFGKKLGPELHEMANGIDESLVLDRPAEQFSRIVTLKRDSEGFDFYDVLKPLCEDLSSKLSYASIKCKSIGIIAITNELKVKTRAKTISEAIQSSDKIQEIASELFSSFFGKQYNPDEGRFKVRRIGVRISDFVESGDSKANTLEDFL